MKTVIFCGGYGTRLNNGKPGPLKPLIKINKKPIIQYIFEIYNRYGYKDFYLLGGYKIQELIKFSKKFKKINVSVINTGNGTPTAGRLMFIKKYLKKNESFFLTYGDSLANFKPNQALKLKKKNNIVISTHDYKPPYGILRLKKNNYVKEIYEKNFVFNINSGFYVLSDNIFNYIKSKKDSFEKDSLPRILKSSMKIKYIKLKKWQPIDNIYDIECAERSLKIKKNYFHE